MWVFLSCQAFDSLVLRKLDLNIKHRKKTTKSFLAKNNIPGLQIVTRPDPSSEFMITYQVTAGQRPLVSQRDFTFLVSAERLSCGTWVAGGCSAHLPALPPTAQFVRAWQHPTCMLVR